MCGTRHTFANAQIKYFAGVAEYNGTQVQSEPAKVYAEWFPDRSWGIAHGYGTKHIPIANAVRLGLRLLVTKESNPRPIDRIVEFRKTANPTVCNAKCRSARGPMCDCSCGGQNHGISVAMSRTRFAASDIDLKPTEQMASNAARGLELREKHGKGGTAVGVARARDIKNRANLSPSTVRRMHSFFSRHEGNQKGGEDDAGYIAWLLWGGDAGKAWAARKSEQLDKSESARFAAHGVRLPSRKGRLNIDAAMAALQQMGYHLQFNTVRYDSSHHPHWKVTQPNGSVVEMSGQQITDLVYQKGKHMKIGTKAAFAINPVVMESIKSHTSKMSDLLRQFIAEAKKSLGNRMDAAWLAQHRATVEGAIRELNNGRVAASVNMAREWADEFAQTYLHHEHTRQLAWIARAIAREPAHVAELAKAHNVPMSRTGAKSTHAADEIGASYLRDIAQLKKYIEEAYNKGRGSHALQLEAQLADMERALAEYKARKPARASRAGAKATMANPTDWWKRFKTGNWVEVYRDGNPLAYGPIIFLNKYSMVVATGSAFSATGEVNVKPSDDVKLIRATTAAEARNAGFKIYNNLGAEKVVHNFGDGWEVVERHSGYTGRNELVLRRRPAQGHAAVLVASIAEAKTKHDSITNWVFRATVEERRPNEWVIKATPADGGYGLGGRGGKPFATAQAAQQELKKMQDAYRKKAGMSRTGAKAAFAANNVDLWNFLSKSDFVIARQNANDLANLKKYASMALTMPDFTPPAHQQHGPSLHTMAKDVLADIKNWEQAVYRNKNRAPFSNTGANAKFGKPRTSTVRRTASGAFEVVYWDANGKEQSHQLHSSEERAIAAAKDVARWMDGQFVASRAGAKSTHAAEIVQKLAGGWVIEREGGILYLAKGSEAIPVPSVERALELHKASVEGRLARRTGGFMSRAGAKSTHALPVPTIANPLNRTEHHGDAIAAINAAIKSGNANEARRLFNLYAHTLNSTEKAGVWGIIRKMIGPQFSRAGAKSDGLTLAQRIAVEHDAKRMAAR